MYLFCSKYWHLFILKQKCDPLCENPAKVILFVIYYFLQKKNHPSYSKEHSVDSENLTIIYLILTE